MFKRAVALCIQLELVLSDGFGETMQIISSFVVGD
jgi:hypothetical protein